jgi:predicted lipoprotein
VDEHVVAQDAWWTAMATWQELEVMQVGPAGSSLTTAGGLDLRDEVYSWPSINTCRVDQETIDRAWTSSSFFTERLVNVYGLDALEYLLFTEDSDNTCPGQIDINATGEWADLGDLGVSKNRSAYAHAIAVHVYQEGLDIHEKWDPYGGDFGAQLSMSGKAATYEDATTALNAIFDALFYLETHTKDEKLAHPLGLLDCGSTDCLEDLESPHAQGSTAWVHANLVGFQKLFTGGSGTGIDDLLVEMGHQGLADRMNGNLAQAIDTSGSLDVALDALFMKDQATALQLYDEVKAVTDDLKGDLSTVLSLQIPSEAAGDND